LGFSNIDRHTYGIIYLVMVFAINVALFFDAATRIALVFSQANQNKVYKKSQHFCGFDIVVKIAIAIIIGLTLKYDTQKQSIILTIVAAILFGVSLLLHVFIYNTTVKSVVNGESQKCANKDS